MRPLTAAEKHLAASPSGATTPSSGTTPALSSSGCACGVWPITFRCWNASWTHATAPAARLGREHCCAVCRCHDRYRIEQHGRTARQLMVRRKLASVCQRDAAQLWRVRPIGHQQPDLAALERRRTACEDAELGAGL